MWSIRVLTGPQAGQKFDLKLGKNTIGRGGVSDLKILSLGISKEHCEIHVYKDKIILVDLKSSNGTFLNGVKVQNAMIKLGDKIGLFDVILDVIPAANLQKKEITSSQKREPSTNFKKSRPPLQQTDGHGGLRMPPQMPPHQAGRSNPQLPQAYMQGANALQLQNDQFNSAAFSQNDLGLVTSTEGASESLVAPAAPKVSLQEKFENYFENAVMPLFYKITKVVPFQQALMGYFVLFTLILTLISVIPLSVLIQESNLIEASKRAKTIARQLAKSNEQLLLSGEFNSLSVLDALKEDGITEAIIIQQSDGSIIAPAEKAGRESNKPFINEARRETRSTFSKISSTLLGASHPIGVYDPISGENTVKFHAVVYYDISSLNVDEGRVISLFMQNLVIGILLSLLFYYILFRWINYPLANLNQQIDQSLRDKTDQTDVKFDFIELQKIITNVNLLLNRVWNGFEQSQSSGGVQNKDVEMNMLVQTISQGCLIIKNDLTVLNANTMFEQLTSISADSIMGKHYSVIVDPALMQKIEIMIQLVQGSPYSVHVERIPFSQFECEVKMQCFFNSENKIEYYILTMMKANPE